MSKKEVVLEKRNARSGEVRIAKMTPTGSILVEVRDYIFDYEKDDFIQNGNLFVSTNDFNSLEEYAKFMTERGDYKLQNSFSSYNNKNEKLMLGYFERDFSGYLVREFAKGSVEPEDFQNPEKLKSLSLDYFKNAPFSEKEKYLYFGGDNVYNKTEELVDFLFEKSDVVESILKPPSEELRRLLNKKEKFEVWEADIFFDEFTLTFPYAENYEATEENLINKMAVKENLNDFDFGEIREFSELLLDCLTVENLKYSSLDSQLKIGLSRFYHENLPKIILEKEKLKENTNKKEQKSKKGKSR